MPYDRATVRQSDRTTERPYDRTTERPYDRAKPNKTPRISQKPQFMSILQCGKKPNFCKKNSKKFLNPKNPQDPPNTFLNQTKLQNPSKPQFMNILQCGKKPNFLKKNEKKIF